MKYALVTGGSRGIGRAVCIALAEEGYSVIINYVSNKDAAQEVKDIIESKGQSAELLAFNVADAQAVDAFHRRRHTQKYHSITCRMHAKTHGINYQAQRNYLPITQLRKHGSGKHRNQKTAHAPDTHCQGEISQRDTQRL